MLRENSRLFRSSVINYIRVNTQRNKKSFSIVHPFDKHSLLVDPDSKALAKCNEQFNEQCSTFMFCTCSSRLATLIGLSLRAAIVSPLYYTSLNQK